MALVSYTFRLPFPPSANHYWRRHGHVMHVSGPGHQFRRDVVADIGGGVPLTGRLGVLLEFVMPDRRKRDIDNYQKPTLDALKHAGVYEDDCLIDDLHSKRLHVEPPGCVDVTIVELTIQEFDG